MLKSNTRATLLHTFSPATANNSGGSQIFEHFNNYVSGKLRERHRGKEKERERERELLQVRHFLLLLPHRNPNASHTSVPWHTRAVFPSPSPAPILSSLLSKAPAGITHTSQLFISSSECSPPLLPNTPFPFPLTLP